MKRVKEFAGPSRCPSHQGDEQDRGGGDLGRHSARRPLGAALRVMAKENREMRVAQAEKKAAQLPAKLTVPMIVFFLPCLFIVILGPTYIKIQMMP